MRVIVSVTVSEILHKSGGSVTQMERHRKIACTPHYVKCGADAHIRRIALRACGKIDSSLSQRYTAFRPPYLCDGVEGCVGKKQGVGIGKPDVLSRAYDQAAGNELGVLTALYHACHPIKRRIRVAATYAFYEG